MMLSQAYSSGISMIFGGEIGGEISGGKGVLSTKGLISLSLRQLRNGGLVT